MTQRLIDVDVLINNLGVEDEDFNFKYMLEEAPIVAIINDEGAIQKVKEESE